MKTVDANAKDTRQPPRPQSVSKLRIRWAQLAEQSLPIPEVRVSIQSLAKFNNEQIYCQLLKKGKEKRGWR